MGFALEMRQSTKHPNPGHPIPVNPNPEHPIPEHPKPEHPIPEHPNPEHPIPEHPNSDMARVRTIPRGIFKVVPFDFSMGIGVTPILLRTKNWEEKKTAFPLFMKYPARRKASGPERMVLWVSPKNGISVGGCRPAFQGLFKTYVRLLGTEPHSV